VFRFITTTIILSTISYYHIAPFPDVEKMKGKKQHQTENLETARTESQSGQPEPGHHQRYEEERTTCPASKRREGGGRGGKKKKKK